MPLFHVSVRHGHTPEEARARLAAAVDQVKARFGPMVRKVEWSADRASVTVAGSAVVLDLRVDADEVHVSGDIPAIGAIFGRPIEEGVRQIVHQAFSKR